MAKAKRGSKRGPGRPKILKADRMEAPINVRVKTAEKKRLAAVAKAANKSLTEWAREALLAAGGRS